MNPHALPLTRPQTPSPLGLVPVPVEGGRVGSPPQLHQLVSGRGVKQADERSFARRRRRHAAGLVQSHAGDLALVGVDGEGGGRGAGLGVG